MEQKDAHIENCIWNGVTRNNLKQIGAGSNDGARTRNFPVLQLNET